MGDSDAFKTIAMAKSEGSFKCKMGNYKTQLYAPHLCKNQKSTEIGDFEITIVGMFPMEERRN